MKDSRGFGIAATGSTWIRRIGGGKSQLTRCDEADLAALLRVRSIDACVTSATSQTSRSLVRSDTQRHSGSFIFPLKVNMTDNVVSELYLKRPTHSRLALMRSRKRRKNELLSEMEDFELSCLPSASRRYTASPFQSAEIYSVSPLGSRIRHGFALSWSK